MIISSILIAFIIYTIVNKNFGKTDNEKFSDEYGITTDNVFVYRTQDEILKILQHGTGIVYLGFPECPWCKAYAKYLNETAMENDIKEILYYDIKKDRQSNNVKYKKLINLLETNLPINDEGNLYISVPYLIFIKDGKIIHTDNETAISYSNVNPTVYWNKDTIKNFKIKISNYINDYKGGK